MLHLLTGGRVERRAAGVPTTTQGLVQRHQAADRVATADQVAVLLLQQQLLSIEHPLKIGEAFAVLRAGQIQRALRSLRGLLANGCTLQRAHQPAGSIVGLTGGFAHALLVQLDQLLQAGIFHAYGVLAPAIVERVPDQAWASRQVEGVGEMIGR
ncbi:hypothetical protein D3C80_1241210 [compost metagenome]